MSLIFILFASFIFAQNEALPTQPPIPKDNPQTQEKIELGKMLYFDPRLSHDGTISCNSCHNVMSAGGDDSRSLSMGIRGQRGGRGAGTVFNAAFYSVQFWDGRAKSLEQQAEGPLVDPAEMGNKDHKSVIDRVKKIPGYVSLFAKVFKDKDPVNLKNLTKAIASYERTLITPNSRFDKYMRGDKKALTDLEKKGYETFQTVGCVTCHSGANFAGPNLPEGTGFYMKFPTFPNTKLEKKYKFSQDVGRFKLTKNMEDKHMYRVPTLRNIAYTAPYFHNGTVNSLEEAVRVMGQTQLNIELSKTQVQQITAFLQTLSGSIPEQTMPKLPPVLNQSVVDIK